MLRFKKGVSIYGLQPEMLWAADRGNEVWEKHGVYWFTVTSGRGDKHGEGSHHPLGLGLDVRRRGLSLEKVKLMVKDLKKVLGPDFDVVIEFDPPHIHIEYDPKNAYTYPTVLIH